MPALPPPYQHPLGIPLNGAKISPSEILFKSVHRENPPIRSYELPNATIRSYNGPYRHGESEYRLDFVFININIFSDRKKNDKDIERFFEWVKTNQIFSFVLFCQNCAYQGGESDRRAERFLFLSSFIKIRERHRDIKGHINNKGKPKFINL
mgnify:CR=1 FL=1